MAVGDNKGQAKIKARGSHSKSAGVAKKKNKHRKKHAAGAEPSAGVGGAVAAALGSDQNVLLLGEGDFGFAAALALGWGDCAQLTATTLADEATTLAHGEGEDNVETVRAFGGTVAFRCDATALHACEAVQRRAQKRGFERIVFNFPLAATRHVADQQALLRGLFAAVLSDRPGSPRLLAKGGEVHLTLRPSDAAAWELATLAKLAGLRVRSSAPFDASRFQGYVPRLGHGPAAAEAAPPGSAATFVLAEAPARVDEAAEKAAALARMAKARPDLRLGPTGQTYKEAWKQRHKKGKR